MVKTHEISRGHFFGRRSKSPDDGRLLKYSPFYAWNIKTGRWEPGFGELWKWKKNICNLFLCPFDTRLVTWPVINNNKLLVVITVVLVYATNNSSSLFGINVLVVLQYYIYTHLTTFIVINSTYTDLQRVQDMFCTKKEVPTYTLPNSGYDKKCSDVGQKRAETRCACKNNNRDVYCMSRWISSIFSFNGLSAVHPQAPQHTSSPPQSVK